MVSSHKGSNRASKAQSKRMSERACLSDGWVRSHGLSAEGTMYKIKKSKISFKLCIGVVRSCSQVSNVWKSAVKWNLTFSGISINWLLTSWMVEASHWRPSGLIFLWVSYPETPMDKNCFAFLFPQQILFTRMEILDTWELCVHVRMGLGDGNRDVDSAVFTPSPPC